MRKSDHFNLSGYAAAPSATPMPTTTWCVSTPRWPWRAKSTRPLTPITPPPTAPISTTPCSPYDANGRVVRATDATGRWRDYSYTTNGQPAGQSLTGVNADGNVALLDHSSTAFDALDRPVSHFDSAGFATHGSRGHAGSRGSRGQVLPFALTI